MNTAAKVRASKELHPEDFCNDPKCLWREWTREGFEPCHKHNPKSRQTAEQVLTNAIRHIRRTHMNTYSWNLPVSDDEAIDLLTNARFWAGRGF